MNKEHLAFLVNAYTENTISRKGYDELMAYLLAAQSEHELDPLLKEIWDENHEENGFDEQRQQFLFQQITGNEAFNQGIAKGTAKVIEWRRWLSVAAGLIFLAIAGPAIWYYTKTPPAAPAALYVTRNVPNGKKIEVQLPDGSLVWVNSGSSIKYSSNFNSYKREVYLSGEAFFDVVHDTRRPFIIHTGQVSTQVLGTAFDVRAYGLNSMSVTVARGKVSVGTAKKTLSVLTPNQVMNYSFESGVAITRRVDASKLKWMNGELTLNNTTLKEAAQEIERWYNVRIDLAHVNAAKRGRRFSATFLNHENIDQVLSVLSELARFSYERTGQQIIIRQQ